MTIRAELEPAGAGRSRPYLSGAGAKHLKATPAPLHPRKVNNVLKFLCILKLPKLRACFEVNKKYNKNILNATSTSGSGAGARARS